MAKSKNTPSKKQESKQSKLQSNVSAQFAGGFTSYLQQDSGGFRVTYAQLRNLANANPFVAMAINKVKQRVTKVPYVIKPKDPLDKTNYDVQISYLQDLLANPNQQDDTYRSLIGKLLDDLLTIDFGVIEEVRNQRGEIVELYNVDAATIRECRDDYGYFMSPAYVQYMPNNLGSTPDASFEANELMIFMVNPSTYGTPGRGKSPVQLVLSSVVSGISAAIYNTSQFTQSSLPPSIVNLKGASPESLKQFKFAFEEQLQGKPWANAYTNAEDLTVELLRPSNQDMQFYELNLWLARIVISAFDLSPQDFGLTMDINRSTAESQNKITRDGGIATYLDLIKEELNTDLIQDLANIDPKFANLCFEFEIAHDLDELRKQTEIDEKQIQMGTRTINELRMRDGLKEVEEEEMEAENQAELAEDSEVEEEGEMDSDKEDIIKKAHRLIELYG